MVAYLMLMLESLWYGLIGKKWWHDTDKICGKSASIRERLEATRDFL